MTSTHKILSAVLLSATCLALAPSSNLVAQETVPGSEPAIAVSPAKTAMPAISTIPMHRLYNPNSGEHFYTAGQGERDALVKVGWKFEGTAWLSASDGQAVYRLYNPNAGDHHYTVSSHERDSLVKVGWKDEGIGWRTAGTIPVYRLYNINAKQAGAHHYTTSSHERDSLIKLGWKDEGIGWYALNK